MGAAFWMHGIMDAEQENQLEQFRLDRLRVTNEPALFVENRVLISGQQAPVYAQQIDKFVPMAEGIRQQQIR